MKKFCLFTIFVFSLLSCHQEMLVTEGMYSDDFMSKLKFKTITEDKISTTRAVFKGLSEQSENTEYDKIDDLSVGIFSVKIARPSTGCEKGFGFCNFKWFPNRDTASNLLENDLYKQSFILKCDEEGNKYVDLELSEKPADLDTDKMQPLVVEETLKSYNIVNGEQQKLVVPQGEYPFNSSIGQFGGYRINLK